MPTLRLGAISRVSSLIARLASLFILILDLLAGAGLETGEHRSNAVLAYAENPRLLLAVLTAEPDGQKMLARLAKQENRRDQQRQSQAAVGLLAVLDQVHVCIRYSDLGFSGIEGQIVFVCQSDGSLRSGFDSYFGAPDVFSTGLGVHQ